jgi:hypothetical protein
MKNTEISNSCFLASIFLAIFLIASYFATVPAALAQDVPNASICVKGGDFEPDYWPLERTNYDFGNMGVGYGEVAVNWVIHPTFEVGFEAGYTNFLIPLDIVARYRFNYLTDQVLVPFLGAGFDVYHLNDENVIPEEDQDGNNWKYGVHGEVGVQILLDYFSPDQARDMKRKWSIINTYLNLEAKFSAVDNFASDDLDLGGNIYTVGILFEF